jgi:hypothetical protein
MDGRIHESRIAHRLGRLFVALSLVASWGAQAALDQKTPDIAPYYMNTMCSLTGYDACQFTSPVGACNSHFSSPWGLTFNEVFVRLVPTTDPYAYQCNYDYNGWGGTHADSPLGVIKVYVTCPTAKPSYAFNIGSGMCERDVCPANSSGTFPSACTCNDGYEPDPTKTSCVSTCPIPGLTPLTDQVAIDFENGNRWRPDGLTADYQTKLKCVQDAVVKKGGTSEGTSAYRPTQYQQHLFEIVDKDKKLYPGYMALHPECQALRDEITRAMGPPPGHALKHKQKVATPGTSRHESGTAFDVTPSGLTDAQLTLVYTGCGVTHTAVSGEPWHVQ